MNTLADIPLSPPGGFKGVGPLGNPSGSGIGTFSQFLSSTIGLLTIVAFIWFVFVFISGAIGIISSGGDKAALESAQKRITNGLIGLVVVIAAIFIVDLIGNLLGIPNILNIAELFNRIAP
jgi:hypothetical protein